jgi:uncharacterized protein YeaO (DUF488 family)
MSIHLKRVYEPSDASDGYRILVDRMWPRGVTKNEAQVAVWLKDAAPTTPLRKWFNHDPEKWKEFTRRYFKELDSRRLTVEYIAEKARRETISLVFAAYEVQHSNAAALKQYLEMHYPEL